MKIYKDWKGSLYTEKELSLKEEKFFTPEGDEAYVIKELPEDIVLLENNKFLIRDYGKYKSGICFIADVPRLEWEDASRLEFNLPKGKLRKIRGNYYVSKKGTKCFKVDSNGQHLIISDDWGGAFNKYQGHTLPEDELYYRRAASNGGRSGYDYAIVPLLWRLTITEDDI